MDVCKHTPTKSEICPICKKEDSVFINIYLKPVGPDEVKGCVHCIRALNRQITARLNDFI